MLDSILAFVIGFSFTIAIYLLYRQYENHKLLQRRLQGRMPTAPFPYAVSKNTKGETEVIIKSHHWDKKSKKLFASGARSKQTVQIYNGLRIASAIVPLILIGVNAAGHSLTNDTLLHAFGAGALFYFFSGSFIKMTKAKRQKAILRTLPQFIDLLVVCVEAGLGFTAALERVLKELNPKDTLTQEFSLMYSEFLGGLSLQETCDRLNKRCQVPDISLFLSAIVQSDQMGASLGKSLRIQAADLRDKYRQRMRAKAYKIPVKILAPVALVFLNIFAISLAPMMISTMATFSGSK